MALRQQSAVEPGEIWLIEQEGGREFCPLDRDVIIGANVVLYDRALEPLVAQILPLGGYAEPLPGDAAAAISPRALAFAADGWSVVQLVEPCVHRRRRIEGAAAALRPLDNRGDVPVRVIAKTVNGRAQRRDGCLPKLAALIDEFTDDELLTVVVGPVAGHPAGRGVAFTANGLAG